MLSAVPSTKDGVKEIENEFEQARDAAIALGDDEAIAQADEDMDNLEYILNEEAGSSEKTFENGNLRRDCDEDNEVLQIRKKTADPKSPGMRIDDFVLKAQELTTPVEGRPSSSPVHKPHVVGLRLYTTSVSQNFEQLSNKTLSSPHHTRHAVVSDVQAPEHPTTQSLTQRAPAPVPDHDALHHTRYQPPARCR